MDSINYLADNRLLLLNLYCNLRFHKTYISLKDMKLQHTFNNRYFCLGLTRSHLLTRNLCVSLICFKCCTQYFACQGVKIISTNIYLEDVLKV